MEFMHVKTVLSLLPYVFVGCRLSLLFSCFCSGLSLFALFCHVKCYKMKRSLEDSDLTEGRYKTKEISAVR